MKTPPIFNACCTVLLLCVIIVGYVYYDFKNNNVVVKIKDKSIWTEASPPPLHVYDPSNYPSTQNSSSENDELPNNEQQIDYNAQTNSISKPVTDQDGLNMPEEQTKPPEPPPIDNEFNDIILPEIEDIPFPVPPDFNEDKESEYTGIVNINTASNSMLCSLDGIGEVIAQRIIDFREINGGFGSIEDLMLVSGIGEVKFNNIKNRLTI